MVYVDSYGNVSPLYLADLQDPNTGKIPPRVVDINAGTAQNYYKYIAHYVTEADYEAVKALGIENPEAYDFNKILEWEFVFDTNCRKLTYNDMIESNLRCSHFISIYDNECQFLAIRSKI